jgi:hypothetical protein
MPERTTKSTRITEDAQRLLWAWNAQVSGGRPTIGGRA